MVALNLFSTFWKNKVFKAFSLDFGCSLLLILFSKIMFKIMYK